MEGNFIKNYFTFSRGERNGIIVLLLLIMLIILAYYLPDFFRPDDQVDFSQFRKEIETFEKQSIAAERNTSTDTTGVAELFPFDPNELDEAGWKKLGIRDKTIRTIINYRSKGGSFREKEDLLKIYGFDTAQYQLLVPYIHIVNHEELEADLFDKPAFSPAKKNIGEKKYFPERGKNKSAEPVIIELNTADSSALTAVKGIGPSLSRRIIKYRSLLGGFVSVEQVREIYGVDSSWFEIIKPSLMVDTTEVSKIPVNSVSREELAKHPYFSKGLANAIISYRQQHGPFRHPEDLLKIYLMNENLYAKIKPYVTLEP